MVEDSQSWPRRYTYYALVLTLPVILLVIVFIVTFPASPDGDPGDGLGIVMFFDTLIVVAVVALALAMISAIELILRRRHRTE